MKEIVKVQYQCEICKKIYDIFESANECEKRPVSQDKGVKVGDCVLILHGAEAGRRATVKSIEVLDREYGHYAWSAYWHSVALIADLDDGTSRRLLFDNYEVVIP